MVAEVPTSSVLVLVFAISVISDSIALAIIILLSISKKISHLFDASLLLITVPHIWNNSHNLKISPSGSLIGVNTWYGVISGNWSRTPAKNTTFPKRPCHIYNQIFHVNVDICGEV